MKTSTLIGRWVSMILLLPLFAVTAHGQIFDSTGHLSRSQSVVSTQGASGADNALRAGVPSMLKTTDYTATDINNKQYNVDEILKSGKFILIDFSAVWCGPCWTLHSSGVLEKLYAKMGPEGTDQLELFWVEASGGTLAQIKGGTGSKGDWTNNGTVPYPIIQDKSMYAALGIPVKGFPSLFLLTPKGEYIECRGEATTSDPDFSELKAIMARYITEDDKPAAVSYSMPADLFVGESLELKAFCNTIAPVTGYQWEATGGTLSATDQETTLLSVDTPGTYTIKLTITNKNGSSSIEKTVTVHKDPISTFPFFCGMDNKDKSDFGWRSLDFDGDGFGFDQFSGNGLLGRLGLSMKGKAGAENSEDCLISWGTDFPVGFDQDLVMEKRTPNNMLVSAPITIAADATKPLFSFFIGSFIRAQVTDQVKVMVASEGKLTKENFATTQILAPTSVSNAWQQIVIDLSAYKGKTIWIAIDHVVNGASGLSVDQLNVAMDGTLGAELPEVATKTVVYPNPANEAFNVTTLTGSRIELFSIEGALLQSVVAQNEITTIDSTSLPEGRYIVRVTDANGATTVRPLVIQR